MSLISNPDFLIHSLRLSYLRGVEDPYGPRLISLDPRYNNNSYILASTLGDSDRWPELAMSSSPQASDDEGSSQKINGSGFPGASGLKYSQTIMGPTRVGGMGMRVSGSRRRPNNLARDTNGINGAEETDESSQNLEPTAGAPPALSIGERGAAMGDGWVSVLPKDKSALSPSPSKRSQPLPDERPTPAPKFIPKFKGAAEMEARRKLRMATRAPAITVKPPPVVIDPESSSSSSSEPEEDEEFEDLASDDGSIGDDDFDPDFVVTQPSDAASEFLHVAVASESPLPAIESPPILKDNRSRTRLSPVSEVSSPRPGAQLNNKTSQASEQTTPVKPDQAAPSRRKGSDTQRHGSRPTLSHKASSVEMAFTRRKVPPVRSGKSALTAMLASSNESSNPFTEHYAAISGRGQTASMDVQVFFPHARKPAGQPMKLNVRKDATVEEVVGFSLWTYWEEGWLPKLDEGLGGDEDPKRAIKLSSIGWIMCMAEDDGEVDDDFPLPDRAQKISKFDLDAYAVLEASPEKVRENQILESKIQRRPSRIMTSSRKVTPVGNLVPAPSAVPASAILSSTILGSVPLSTSLGPSTSHGPQIFLRIRVADAADAVHISSTIPVSAGMYIQEAMDKFCEKRKINPKEYALLLRDKNIFVPTDRTVASLQGQRDLILVKRSMLPSYGIDDMKATPRTMDPNTSIFKRISEVPAVQQSAAMDFTSAYQKYTVYRKMPMLVTRMERTLAIDGAYIHIMPSANKARAAVFESGKTASYHMQSIVACQQSAKSSSLFKLVVSGDRGHKRYDFEAESAKAASEIVHSIKSLRQALERSGTITKNRRSVVVKKT